jgi:hypothetical protein
MKKLLIPCLLLIQASSYAQFKVVAESPSFREPEGLAQILQMKNGNTLFIRDGHPGSYDLQIFDAQHQLKLRQKIAPDSGKRGYYGITSIFETKGDIAIFLNNGEKDTLMLYRLVVDGNTGKVKKEEKIAVMKAMTRGQMYGMWLKGTPEQDFIVRKDLYSDNYAVASLNSFASDRNKRVEVMLYNDDHVELSRAYYTSPEDKYKYLKFIDMSVVNKEKVCMLAYAYRTRVRDDKERELVVASLDKGAAALTLDELEFSEFMKIDHGLTRFNPVTQKLLLLADLASDHIPVQHAILVSIDPVTRKIENTIEAFPEDANRKNIELFGRRPALNATPQGLVVHTDGSFSIVSEETTYFRSSPEGLTDNGTELGNITVSTFDTSGKQVKSYLAPKKHFYFSNKKSAFYTAYQLGDMSYEGDEYKSFVYINGKDKMYVLFNDDEENTEKVLKGKLTTIRRIGKCDAYYYTLSGDHVLPARGQVFGKPENEQDHNLALFLGSDYDPVRDLFITLKLEVNGNDKRMKLVWMSPS